MKLFLLIASGDWLDAVGTVEKHGCCAGLLVLSLIFFSWRDCKREARLIERIETLEDEIRNALLPLVKEWTG